MKAVVLAAGIGAALGNSRAGNLTNILLRFAGPVFRHRRIDRLKRSGIEELVLEFKPDATEIDCFVDVEQTNVEFLPRINASTRHASHSAVSDGATGRMCNHE